MAAITGTTAGDVLNGTAGDDSIAGLAGADVITGAGGNDALDGGRGADVYVYASGDGNDTITDTAVYLEHDTLRLTNLNAGDITLLNLNDGKGTMRLAVKATGETIDIAQFGSTAWQGIERLEFADGTVWITTVINTLAIERGTFLNGVALVGTSAVDLITGTNQSEFIFGLQSGDTVNALDGNDTVYGDIGADTLDGGGGADRLYGGAYNDKLYGQAGDDILDGGTGNDTLVGGAGDDWFYVDTSFDTVVEVAGEGHDTVSASYSYTLGATLEDLVLTGSGLTGTGNAGANAIYAESGNDTLYGLDGDDRLSGFFGDDVLEGGAGDDVLNGGNGADLMTGGDGGDVYWVDNPGDVVVETGWFGLGGFDRVRTQIDYVLAANVEELEMAGGAINATGNELDNVIYDNGRDNVLDGGAGHDLIQAGEGADALIGGAGADRLFGGVGDDRLVGGAGRDSYNGAEGADRLVFETAQDSAPSDPDGVIGFDVAEDVVDLSAIDADPTLAGDQAFTLVAAFSGQAGQAQLAYDAASNATTLQLDVDGDGVADSAIVFAGWSGDGSTGFVW